MRLYLLLFFIFSSFNSIAQVVVEGWIKDEENNALPFTSIQVKNTSIGTTSNVDAFYKIKLPPGEYFIIFNHLGYKTVEKKVILNESPVELNIILPKQVYTIKSVEVSAKDEDPAYRVMRNAIAKAKYHEMVIKSYETKVYIKGTFDLQKVPRIARSLLKKEGLDPDKTYTSESISLVTYTRPNKIEEQILSYNTTIKDIERPTIFVIGNFYKSEVAGIPSPLSQRAFSYYRYSLEGVFYENGKEINKIRVIPKRSANLFEGHIYIAENSWTITNLKLSGKIDGAMVSLVQNYAEIEKDIWMPLTQQLDIVQKLYGFNFGFQYVTATEKFDVELDSDLVSDMEKMLVENLIDEEEVEKEIKENKEKEKSDGQTPIENEKITNKELKKFIKDYEKQKLKDSSQPKIVSIRNFAIDSAGLNRDSTYWNTYRPIPLSEKEAKTYEKIDEEIQENNNDSVKKNKLNILSPIMGSSIKLNESLKFRWNPIFEQSGFNTVEGWVIASAVKWFNDNKKDAVNWQISPVVRYGFASQRFNYKLNSEIHFKEKKNLKLAFDGGKHVFQFNNNQPISYLENTLSTLFFEDNYMKIYEKYFSEISASIEPLDGLTFSTHFSWNLRQPLNNNSDFKLINYKDKEYTSNLPNEDFSTNDLFEKHQVLLYGASVKYQPFIKYIIRNNEKIALRNSSPTFILSWNAGKGVEKEENDFNHFSADVRWVKRVGITGNFNFFGSTGFFTNNNLNFMDYEHFMGNQLFFRFNSNYLQQFRLLDYYKHSSSSYYLELHFIQEFRQLLLTQIAPLQMLGINENLQIHYLRVPDNNITEIAYGLNNVFGIVNLEFAVSFENQYFKTNGFRISVFSRLNK